jgi:hypothetical protein
VNDELEKKWKKVDWPNLRYYTGLCIERLRKKSKAVPLHAMVALGGRGGIAPTHFDLCTRWGERSESRPGRTLPRERTLGNHCTGGWEDLRAGLDTEVRGKILCLCRGSNPDRQVRSQTLY